MSFSRSTRSTTYSYQQQPHHQPDALDRESLAATKIQAGYRGYRTRKEYENLVHSSPRHNRSSGNDSYSMSMSPQSPASNYCDLDNAATRIQASYRGYLTRKALRDDNMPKHTTMSCTKMPSTTAIGTTGRYPAYRELGGQKSRHNAGDVDDDVKVKAVTKIQAGYRGYKTRKSLAPLLHHEDRENPILNKENDNFSFSCRGYTPTMHERSRNVHSTSLNSKTVTYDPESAATKIQAIYRGYKTRQHLPK
ncbi:unnamed protein product [Trichobilharzia szidati]|nr:unnamed protein product [Trichobilharzia szidati]